MNLTFSPAAWEDYTYWQRTDAATLDRINALLKDILRDPRAGIGKPEPLKHQYKGFWSRRIDREHRLIYKPAEGGISIAALRYYY